MSTRRVRELFHQAAVSEFRPQKRASWMADLLLVPDVLIRPSSTISAITYYEKMSGRGRNTRAIASVRPVRTSPLLKIWDASMVKPFPSIAGYYEVCQKVRKAMNEYTPHHEAGASQRRTILLRIGPYWTSVGGSGRTSSAEVKSAMLSEKKSSVSPIFV